MTERKIVRTELEKLLATYAEVAALEARRPRTTIETAVPFEVLVAMRRAA